MDPHATAQLRARIIDAAVICVIDGGPTALSSRRVAELAGVDVPVVEDQFPSRDSMTATVVDRWGGALTDPLLPIATEQGTVAYLQALVATFAREPQLMQLIAGVLGAATDPHSPGAAYYREIYHRFATTIRESLVRDFASGREVSAVSAEHAARQLLALYDGFRLQSLLVPNVPIEVAFDQGVAALRRGWVEVAAEL
ncbi:TetR/AcrR family transcriptional regulator [Curtobacterium sp. RRHDQ10]|uniref:TetR/AcrR family transcriptional regulator n=1 Tax=Curtobacterium phyllosphaerae TaxID=3413379 RepID=UPI003BF21132